MPDGTISITPFSAPGRRLEVTTMGNLNGTRLRIWNSSNFLEQRFYLPQISGSGGHRRIVPVYNVGIGLDVEGGSTANGAQLQTWQWDSSALNQQFLFIRV
ncbi:MAG: RICIN domain-containing protein, partial [Oscillospiraceae bacterium]|nr:RICIN domain-containing protein [Oscillospiraceae bacterium]